MDIPLDRKKNVRSLFPKQLHRRCCDLSLKFNYESVLVDPLSGIYSLAPQEDASKFGDHTTGERSTFVQRIEDTTLEKIESDYAHGLTSKEILALFSRHQISFSEATLRKYVQLGLLPRSVRVGSKGKHQGSKGVYPVRVVRQILLVKAMMAQDFTIEQIQSEFLFLRGDLEQLESTLGGILVKLGDATEAAAGFTGRLSREVKAAETVGRDLMMRLRTLESRLMAERRDARLGVGFPVEAQAVG